jgi:hypothetical protein
MELLPWTALGHVLDFSQTRTDVSLWLFALTFHELIEPQSMITAVDLRYEYIQVTIVIQVLHDAIIPIAPFSQGNT